MPREEPSRRSSTTATRRATRRPERSSTSFFSFFSWTRSLFVVSPLPSLAVTLSVSLVECPSAAKCPWLRERETIKRCEGRRDGDLGQPRRRSLTRRQAGKGRVRAQRWYRTKGRRAKEERRVGCEDAGEDDERAQRSGRTRVEKRIVKREVIVEEDAVTVVRPVPLQCCEARERQ